MSSSALYYSPLHAYLDTSDALASATAEVQELRSAAAALERRLAPTRRSDAALAREARRLGLVKPGEQLFIVKGIEALA